MSWLTSWSNRRQITIAGAAGAGTLYQVPLLIGESAGATGFNFHLGGLSAIFPTGKNVGGDLRFTAGDGTTLEHFWVESVSGTAPNRTARIWVRVSADLGVERNIFCYFGNATATNVSHGDNTFIFFDDFDVATLDTTKWNRWATGGSFLISGSVITVNGGASWEAIGGRTQRTAPVAMRCLGRRTESTFAGRLNSVGFDDRSATGTRHGTGFDVIIFWWENINNSYQNFREGIKTSISTTRSLTSFRILEIQWLADSTRFLEDDVSQAIITTNVPVDQSGVLLQALQPESQVFIDWVCLRRFVSPEPVFSSAGAIVSLAAFLAARARRGLIMSM